MNTNLIYTVIFGKRDWLKDPVCMTSNCDYLCLTDDPDLKSNIWKIVVIKPKQLHVKKPIELMIKSHEYAKNYEHSLYVAGNIRINKLVIFEFLKDFDIALKRHNIRYNILEESKKILSNKNLYKKEDLDSLRKQVEDYSIEGFPTDKGLWDTSIIFRKTGKNLENFENLWYSQIEKYNSFDQISFPYSYWKCKDMIKVATMRTDMINDLQMTPMDSSRPFQIFPHNQK